MSVREVSDVSINRLGSAVRADDLGVEAAAMKALLLACLATLAVGCAPMEVSGPDACTPQCGTVCGGSNGCGGTCTGLCDNGDPCTQSTTTGDFFCWREVHAADGGTE